MIVVGLTGGIATGKSTTAKLFRERGIPIHDADKTVHSLMGPGGDAVDAVVARFGANMLEADGKNQAPEGIDRQKLGAEIFQNPDKRKILEDILHPLVAEDRDRFLAENRDLGTEMVVLDVPLLFEAGSSKICDLVVVAYASPEVQTERAMARAGMTRDKLAGILQSQRPMLDKIEQADLVVDTQNGIDAARQQLFRWLDQLPTKNPKPV